MTSQEIFDDIVCHLRVQNAKSLNGQEFCLYRNPFKNLSCAIGCLIQDDEYDFSYEGAGDIKNLLNFANCSAKLKERFAPHKDLLFDLQTIHDRIEIKDWETQFEKIATKNYLILCEWDLVEETTDVHQNVV